MLNYLVQAQRLFQRIRILNDKFITVHPHGKDHKGQAVYIKDGETPKQAMERQFKTKITPKYKKKRIVKLSKKEYARVMSELRTHTTQEQREDIVFVKYIGDSGYICKFEEDNFIILKKKGIR